MADTKFTPGRSWRQAVQTYKVDYQPSSITFAQGFEGPRGDVGYTMAMNLQKAQTIIEELLAAGEKIQRAEIGLDGDWGVNHAEIYPTRDEEEIENVYKASIWATPTLLVFFDDRPSRAYEIYDSVPYD